LERRNDKMGDLGIFASKFNISSKSLKEFDSALHYLRTSTVVTKTPEEKEMVDKLLSVVGPISEVIRGNLSDSTIVNERNISEILKSRHDREWPAYRERILKLNSKLNSDRFQFSNDDLLLLNDIANALDAEIVNLFRRMSEK
jgi:hypothetical protein